MSKFLVASSLLTAFISVGIHAESASDTDITPTPVPVDDTAPAASGSDSTQKNDGNWHGSGEFGFAATTGNSRTQNIDAKLGLNQETEYWKNNFFLDALRSKGDVSVTDASGATVNTYSTTANRYDGGASTGYKFDERSYLVTAVRYEHDDFGADLWQGIVSIGYGYMAIKDQHNELSFEIGPGYKEYRPSQAIIIGTSSNQAPYGAGVQEEVVARSLVNYKYRFNANVSLDDTFLMEAGSKDQYYQNDLGLAVTMTKKLALKIGFEERHHSAVLPGIKHNDTLTTTNLVYNF